MSDDNTLTVSSDSGGITTTSTGDYPYYYDYTKSLRYQEPIVSIPSVWTEPYYEWKNISGSLTRIIEKGDDNMRYLYEVILVNPKRDAFSICKVVAKSETSAIMKAYKQTQETKVDAIWGIDFDDLKTQCRILMEWKKEKSLTKAIETIKKAVE